MIHKDGVSMGGTLISSTKLICGHVEELVLILARAVSDLTVTAVNVYDSYHRHAMISFFVDAFGKITHAVDGDEGIYVNLDLVDSLFD
jgi:hypothetical protein